MAQAIRQAWWCQKRRTRLLEFDCAEVFDFSTDAAGKMWPLCNRSRHANVGVTMNHYVQAVTPAKRRAQRGIVGLLDPNGPTKVARPLASARKDGGRYRIRTYDFHREKT